MRKNSPWLGELVSVWAKTARSRRWKWSRSKSFELICARQFMTFYQQAWQTAISIQQSSLKLWFKFRISIHEGYHVCHPGSFNCCPGEVKQMMFLSSTACALINSCFSSHLRSPGSASCLPRSLPCGGSPGFCVAAELSLAPAASDLTPNSSCCPPERKRKRNRRFSRHHIELLSPWFSNSKEVLQALYIKVI